MGVLDTVASGALGIANEAIGNIEKAQLTLYDYRNVENTFKIEEYEPGRSKMSASGLDGKLSGSRFFDTGSLDAAGLAEAGKSLVTNMMLSGAKTRERTFIVKFNPSTLSLQGMGGGRYSITNYDEPEDHGSSITYGALDTRVQFSVQLIFDTTRNFDLTKSLVEAARGKKETIENSVRMQVEGFVGALRNPRTRMLQFAWGKMSYRGTLNTLNVQYTMFSSEGYPVRAIVQFGMILVDEKVYKGGMSWWKDRVEEVFPSDLGLGIQTTNNVSASQYVSSLLNLSL